MKQRARIISVLGGHKLVGRQIKSFFDMQKLIIDGIPSKASDYLKRTLNLTDRELAGFLGISPSTLRRRRSSSGRLPFIASDRLYRIASILSLAIMSLGDKRYASKWMRSPQTELGGEVPFDFISTYAEALEVEKMLYKILCRAVFPET